MSRHTKDDDEATTPGPDPRLDSVTEPETEPGALVSGAERHRVHSLSIDDLLPESLLAFPDEAPTAMLHVPTAQEAADGAFPDESTASDFASTDARTAIPLPADELLATATADAADVATEFSSEATAPDLDVPQAARAFGLEQAGAMPDPIAADDASELGFPAEATAQDHELPGAAHEVPPPALTPIMPPPALAPFRIGRDSPRSRLVDSGVHDREHGREPDRDHGRDRVDDSVIVHSENTPTKALNVGQMAPRVTYHYRDDEPAPSGVIDEVWSRLATPLQAAPPGLLDRAHRLSVVFAVIRAALPPSRELRELIVLGRDVAAARERAQGREGAHGAPDVADDLRGELERIEAALSELERGVPVASLRHVIDDRTPDDQTLADYLRFVVDRFEFTPECWSRVDLLATRLVRHRRPDGLFDVRRADEVAPLWLGRLPPSQTSEHVRASAVAFFAEAIGRLDALHDPGQLVSSGFYVDVLGYKLALRADYFDPPVLYAAAQFNVALDRWLSVRWQPGRPSRDPIAAERWFGVMRESVRKLFADLERDEGERDPEYAYDLRASHPQRAGPRQARASRAARRRRPDGADEPTAIAARSKHALSPRGRRRWWWLLVVAALVGGAAYAYPHVLDYLRARGLVDAPATPPTVHDPPETI